MFEPSKAPARAPKRLISFALSLGVLASAIFAPAQVPMFGGNAQHTNLYNNAAQEVNKIRWQTSIDTSNSGEFGHYGAPLVTANNTVIVPVLISGVGVQLNAYNGADGTFKYTLNTDYIFPPHNWLPEYQPCIAGSRLYYQGAGGTVYYVDNIDSNTPTAPTQLCFYGLATYQANAANFNSSVFIDTPITADSSGNIYFGFRIPNGVTAPAPFTTISGYAKIDSTGNGIYALVDAMTADVNISRDIHNTAPALSNDESKLYVVAGKNDTRYYGYLVALNTSDLSTSSKVFLKDPRNGNNAGVLDDGTASPMVAPDGDVYLGVFANPYNGSRGFLSHFSGDLSETKLFGGFGWDYTAGVVPASMIPSYNGPSSYLLFCKYNNYDTTGLDDGDGVNRVAIIDPNASEVDAHPSSNGMEVMREVQTVIGFTPDSETPWNPIGVREMCVNATCVNSATNSVFFNCEDGRAYRWDLANNIVSQSMVLTPGFGEPYVPTVVGPDGTVYTLNGGWLFALGSEDGDSITVASSKPDSRFALTTDNITFTAHVNNFTADAGNTVTFTDNYFDGFNYISNPIGGPVSLDGSGNAQVTTTLSAGGTQLGNHFITAAYSGNNTDHAASVTAVQKVHALASSVAVYAEGADYGLPVSIMAVVNGDGNIVPTGQVTFLNDGKVIGQAPLDGNGQVAFQANGLKAGVRDLQAFYQSDTWYASSASIQEVTVHDGTTMTVGSAPNPSTFGQQVTFTANVTPADAGAGVPQGNVVFTIDGVAGAPVAVDGSGVATYKTSSLAVGSHTLSAAFTGSTGWGDSSAIGANQVVNPGNQDSTPSTPQNVHVNPGGKNALTVTWDPSTDAVDAIDHYEIWRSNKHEGPFSLITTVKGTSFTQVVGNNQTRYYAIVAVDEHGNKSQPSAVAGGTSPDHSGGGKGH